MYGGSGSCPCSFHNVHQRTISASAHHPAAVAERLPEPQAISAHQKLAVELQAPRRPDKRLPALTFLIPARRRRPDEKYLHRAAALLVGLHSGRQHLGVVEYQGVPRPEHPLQFEELAVLYSSSRRQSHQPAAVPGLGGSLRDGLRKKVEFELFYPHAPATPPWGWARGHCPDTVPTPRPSSRSTSDGRCPARG